MATMKHPAQLGLIAVAALALGACAWLWQRGRAQEQVATQRLGALEQENRRLAAAIPPLEQANDALRAQLKEQGIEPAAPPPPRVSDADSRRVEAVRELAATQGKLAAAAASLTELQNRVHELESQVEKATAESRRLAASEASLKEDLDAAHRLAQATDAELKTKAERVAQLEGAVRQAQEERNAALKRASQAGGWLDELVEVNRRRENTVSALQRRYREATDQVRALAARMERDRDHTVASAAPDASRMQALVQSAEDDLRQLSGLNTQAQSLARRLNQK